nr:MAG TPA: hypothetical protein [Caudoviricetes sp.]
MVRIKTASELSRRFNCSAIPNSSVRKKFLLSQL